jgi:HK97 family phage prohead protease
MPWSDYPQAATDNAQRALDHRAEYDSECGTAVGWETARILADRDEVSVERLPRIYSFLSRAKVYDQGDFIDSEGKEICGSVMYAAWGGDEMLEWASEIYKTSEEYKRAAGERVSFDYDGTLTTMKGLELLQKEQNDGSEIYIISAREDDDELLTFAAEHDIPESYVYATGSNEKKIEKVNELGIVRHYDDNVDVIAEIGGVGVLVASRAMPGELELGDFVRWNTSNGFAYGRVIEIAVEGELEADSGFVVNATEDDPAAKIRIYEYDADLAAYVEQQPPLNVVHRFSTLEKYDADVRNNVPVMERRITTQRADVTGNTIRGYAAVFNSPSEDLGGFIEYIAPGAFDSVMNDDVRGFYNHDWNYLLGRVSSGTLRIFLDEVGLGYEIDLPNTSYANDLAELMKRGDVNQSSFAFMIESDKWEVKGKQNIRTITKVSRLIDVAPVVIPAYPAATSKLVSRALDTDAELITDINVELAAKNITENVNEVERPNLRSFILRIINLHS